jgi:hypothetical protein
VLVVPSLYMAARVARGLLIESVLFMKDMVARWAPSASTLYFDC